MTSSNTFENTYHHYPFAPLVKFGVAVATWLKANFGGTGAADGRQGRSKPEALGHAA